MTSATRNDLVAAFLLAGQHRIDPAGGPGTRWPPSDAVPSAAAALAAGEPGRARRALASAAEPDDAGHAVLAHAIVTFDRQWTLGGAGSLLTDEAVTQLEEADSALPAAARRTPLGVLGVQLLPELFAARLMVEDERRAGLAALAGRRRRRLDTAERWTGLGPAARSYLALACADLAHRERDEAAAEAATQRAHAFADGDAAAQAHIELVHGDWRVEPRRHVETLGLGGPAADYRDLSAAEEHYARACRLWSAIGSRGGRAAIELRRAHLARLAGRADERDERLARAYVLAGEAGERALAALVTVHALIDTIADGHRVPPESIDQVGEWVRGDGSRSYGRGLLRLLLARARAWRDEGDFTRAHSAVKLARRLAGTEENGGSVSVDLAAIYGGAGYRRARLARAEAELAAALDHAGERTLTVVHWMTLAVRAQELFAEATALADPAAVSSAAARLSRLLELPVRPAPDDMAVVAAAYAELAASWGRSAALRGWYEGLRRRDQGREDAAQHAFRQALVAAGEDDFLRCAVLAAMPRPEEALTAALAFADALPPLAAATLFLRLEQADLAELALAGADEPADPPWLPAALWARLHRLRGAAGPQVQCAREAVATFERRRDRLARDLLRSAASDDPIVAGAYHDLVTGLVAGGAERDALAASDLARGLPYALLTDLAAETGETRRACRAWLAAESRWAASSEEVVRSGAARAGAMDEAEAALDEAEERVRRVAPDLLRRRVGPPPDVAAAIASLPEDGVLLAYHHGDRELIGWAATADGRIACTGTVRDPEVIGCAARWQTALARGETDPAAAAVLADRLLAPFADRLAGRRRVVVVPHRDLSVVPFHALPWCGGVFGDDYDVSYLPAVGLLRPSPGDDAPRFASALVVGDPAVDPARGLRRLPGARCEALAVADLLGADPPLLDGDATVDLVRKLAPAADVLHLGSHAIVPPGAPNLGHLALAGADRLAVADLLDLDLSATLVVLSACRTGTGAATLGGDVVGMTRAVLLAGARHAVVSLWPVDDAVGALLMLDFYRSLSAGEPPAAALAQAQRAVRRQNTEQLSTEYAALAARYGVTPDAAGLRDAGPERDAPADPVHGWAPFIHVGGFR